MSQPSGSLVSILLALGANFLIAMMKLAAALATGSGAMTAEAVHSFADCGNQGLLLLGMRQAKRPPSPDYPLGYGRATYFWSFIVAVMLFSLGGLFSVYEGIHKLRHPEPIERPWLALGILGASIILEAVSFAGCMRAVRRVRGGRGLVSWFRQSRQSELIVVFGEDLAALLGLTLAALAVILTMLTSNPLFDALGSVAIGALLVLVALAVGNQIKNLLIGESVDPATRVEIREFLSSRPSVRRLINVITLQLGPDVMVAVKAEMAVEDARGMIDAINEIERRIKERFPSVRWVFFEPDRE